MINSLRVTNHLGESLTLELAPLDSSPFYILNIDGLGPAKANINMNELVTSDGSLYNSARLNPRNIVLTLKMRDYPTIEDSRLASYRYFPIKKRIKLTLNTDNRISTIYGYVESNEPVIFSRSETTQISIICPDPYFYDTSDEVVISGVDSNFEFPFANESLTEDLLEMSVLNVGQEYNIYYEGDAEVGFTIRMQASGDVENVTIYNTGDGRFMKIDTAKLLALTGSIIVNGDEIVIVTRRGSKSITLIRNGVSTNILNTLDKTSEWLTLVRGDNVIAFIADNGGSNLQLTIEHQSRYEGV